MRFLDLYIRGFGKFHNASLSFEDGLNLVYGKNEAGKSTIHTFIRGMLFGIERGRGRAARSDTYSRYEPWENSGAYEGQLRLESDGMIYRIERSFLRGRKEFTIVNETTGREETDARAFMDELLGGISETAYNNTISISQLKSATEDGMISELKNYIANLNTTGSMALNVTKAAAYLKTQKKQLEAQLRPEASRTYTQLLAEIRTLEQEVNSPQYENQMQENLSRRESVKTQIEISQQEKEELADKIGRGRQLLEQFEFPDEASIHAYLEQNETIYQNYCESKTIVESRISRLLPFLFYGLALLFAADSAYSAYWYLVPDNRILPLFPAALDPFLCAVGLGIGAAVSAAVGLFLHLRRRRHRKEAGLCQATLSEVLRRHLGDSAISEEAMDALQARMAEFIRLCQITEKSETTLQNQMEKIASLMEQQNSCSEEIEKQQHIQWELEKKLEHLSDCKDRAAALKEILQENDRIRQEIAAVDLAQDTLQELSMSIRDSFGLYLNKSASDLIAGITGGVYASMSIDENLNAFLNTRKKLIPLEQVSSGTADQIYLALRLAAAKFIQKGEDRLPLIFDDSFVLYDDERLRSALTWLSKAYQGQIILFSCHTREERILKESGVTFHKIEI